MRTLLVLAGLSFSSVVLTPPDASAQVKDMCTLLTQAEAEAILGRKPVPPEKQTSGDCWYAGGEIMLHALGRPFASGAELMAQVESDVKKINDRTKAKGVPMNMEMTEVTVPQGQAGADYRSGGRGKKKAPGILGAFRVLAVESGNLVRGRLAGHSLAEGQDGQSGLGLQNWGHKSFLHGQTPRRVVGSL